MQIPTFPHVHSALRQPATRHRSIASPLFGSKPDTVVFNTVSGLSNDEIARRRLALPISIQMLFPYGTRPKHFVQLKQAINDHPLLKTRPAFQAALLKTLESGDASLMAPYQQQEDRLLDAVDKLARVLAKMSQDENGYYDLKSEVLQPLLETMKPSPIRRELIERFARDFGEDWKMEMGLESLEELTSPKLQAAILQEVEKTRKDVQALKRKAAKRKDSPDSNWLNQTVNMIARLLPSPAKLKVSDFPASRLKMLNHDKERALNAFNAAADDATLIHLSNHLFEHGNYDTYHLPQQFAERIQDTASAVSVLQHCVDKCHYLQTDALNHLMERPQSDTERLKYLDEALSGKHCEAWEGKAIEALYTLEDNSLMWSRLQNYAASDKKHRRQSVLSALKHIPGIHPEKEALLIQVVHADVNEKEVLRALPDIMHGDLTDDTRKTVIKCLFTNGIYCDCSETAAACVGSFTDLALGESFLKHPRFVNGLSSSRKPFVTSLAKRYIAEIEKMSQDIPFLELIESALLASPSLDMRTYNLMTMASALGTCKASGQDGLHFVNRLLKDYHEAGEHLKSKGDKLFRHHSERRSWHWLRYQGGYEILKTLTLCSLGSFKRNFNNSLERGVAFTEAVDRVASHPKTLSAIRQRAADPNEAEKIIGLAEGYQQLGLDDALVQVLKTPGLQSHDLAKAFLTTLAAQTGLATVDPTRFNDWDLSQVHTLGSAFRRAKHPEKFMQLLNGTLSGHYVDIDHGGKAFLHQPDTDFGQANLATQAAFGRPFKAPGLGGLVGKTRRLNYDLWLSYPQTLSFALQPISLEAQTQHLLEGISADLRTLQQDENIAKSLTEELTKHNLKLEHKRLVKADTGATPSAADLKALLENFHMSNWYIKENYGKNRDLYKEVYSRFDTIGLDGTAFWLHRAEALGTWPQAPQELEIGLWKRIPGRDLFHSNYVQNCIAISTPKNYEKGHVDTLVEALLHTFVQVAEVRNKATGEVIGQSFLTWGENQDTNRPELLAHHVSLAKGYKHHPQISNALSVFFNQLAKDVSGYAAPVRLGGGGFNDATSLKSHKVQVETQLVGGTYHKKFYLDPFQKGQWDPVAIDQPKTGLFQEFPARPADVHTIRWLKPKA